MFRKKLVKLQALALSVAMLGTLFQVSLVSAETAEDVIYQNDFEADETAVLIGGNKALEFTAEGDITNSWVSVFQQDLYTEYTNKINSGATLSFDLYLPAESTYAGTLKAQAVTKMGSAWTWTQSATIPEIGINKFADSGDGYLKASVSIPFGSEIEEIQGLKSVVPCLAASNCDYTGKIYLDNVKLVNSVVPVVEEVIYQNDFEKDATAVAIGETKALEYTVAGDVTNSWVNVFQQDLFTEYTGKIYEGAKLSFDLYLPAESTYTGALKAVAVTKMGSAWTWTQSATIPELGINKFEDTGDGYLKASVSIPFGSEIEEIQGLKSVVPCLAASNCDYTGKVYLDNVKLVNGISNEEPPLPEVTPIVFDFAKAEDITGWANGGSYAYNGGLTIGHDAAVGEGSMMLGVDYSADSAASWSEAKVMYSFAEQAQLEGYNQFSFDFIYDPAKMTMGSFKVKLFAGTIDKNANITDVEDYGNGLKKATVVINFSSSANSIINFTLGIVGSNIDYKGIIYIDNVTFSQAVIEDNYVLATKTVEEQIPVSVTSDSVTANGMTQEIPNSVKLTDDKAIKSAAQLYAYLEAVGKTDSVLFGHQNDITCKAGNVALSKSDVEDVTGSTAAVMGIDALALTGNELSVAQWNATLEERVAACAKVTKEAADKGAVITFSAHMPNFDVIDKRVKLGIGLDNPTYGNNSEKVGILADGSYNFSGYTPNNCTGDVVARIMPRQDLNKYFTAYLDMIADYAKVLEKDNISVLFRPFHECTGGWFWWGKGNCDAEAYINLYRYTVSYLRDVKGVHNFIYVYGPSSEAASTAEYGIRYPGDDYVDMVGFDMYHQTPAEGDSFISNFTTELSIVQKFAEEHNKLFAVTETGMASGSTPVLIKGNPRKDWYNEILDAVVGSKASYFLVWANFDTTNFYTPYVVSNAGEPMKGHEMLDYFIDFYNKPNSVFAKQIGDYTAIDVSIQTNTNTSGYIMAPTSGSRVLEPMTLEANVSNAKDSSVVKFIAKNKTGAVAKEITAAKNESGIYTASLTKEILNAVGETLGTISLSVDGKVVNTINAKFNMPEPVIDPLVVDTFEYYYGDNELLNSNWTMGNGTGCTLVPSLTSKSYESKYGLEFKYSLASNGYIGIVKNMNGADWSSKNAVQLWTIPDGKKQKVVIQVTSGSNVFEVYLNQYADYYGSTEPVLVTIPFSSFVGRDDKTAVFDPANIESFGLWSNTIVPEGEDASTYKLDSALYYDDIKVVTSDVTTVTFKKISTGDEIILGDVNGDTHVNSIDFALLRWHLLGFEYLEGDALKAADVNKDGNANSIDFALVRKYILTGKF
ncbi:glycosyl hydrolase [Acetivibrio cellulolyticus]|uniref:glycosyl hydrolase n=1 Tax=Acetivibrio cellulolyticus TaxID=35830 RepID=UPI0001E300DB|nr:glycosyl hydrolase [Acetivibrio cellulolyticus]